VKGAPTADVYGLPIPSTSSDLADTVAAELAHVGRLHSVAGVAALTVARRIDAGAESSAGLAALIRELRNCMADALADVEIQSEPSALELIAARRQERRSATANPVQLQPRVTV